MLGLYPLAKLAPKAICTLLLATILFKIVKNERKKERKRKKERRKEAREEGRLIVVSSMKFNYGVFVVVSSCFLCFQN